MQVHLPERAIVDSSNLSTATFTVPPSAMAKLASTFISGLYSDPTRFVYELVANARDASRDVKVTLPTSLSRNFVVEDAGEGMTREFMMGGPYTQILSSTKDRDDTKIGGWGVGRLSALAICDSYLIETRYNSYLVRKDERGIPQIAHVGTSDVCGTRVTVAVPPGKVDDVRHAAYHALKWYDPPVRCNLDIPRPEILFGSRELGWAFRRSSGSETPQLVMGGYPYPLELNDIDDTAYRWNCHWRGLVLFAGPGFADVTANRQSLTYNDRTKANIKALLDKMKADLTAQVEREIAACATIFAAKRKLKEAVGTLPVLLQGVTYRGKPLVSWIGPAITGPVWIAEVGRRSRDVRKISVCDPKHTDAPEKLFVYDGDVPPKGTVARLYHAGHTSAILLRTSQADELEVPASCRIKVEDLPKPPPPVRGSSAPAKWWQMSPGRHTFGDFYARLSQLPAHAHYVRFDRGEPAGNRTTYDLARLLDGFAAFPHELYGIPKSGKVPQGWTEFTPALIRDHVKQELSKLGDVGRLLAIKEAWHEHVHHQVKNAIDAGHKKGPVPYQRLAGLKAELDRFPHDPRAIGAKLEQVGLPPLQLPELKPNDDPKRLSDEVLKLRPMLTLVLRGDVEIIAAYIQKP